MRLSLSPMVSKYLVKLLLQLLISIINTELLKAVHFKCLEPKGTKTSLVTSISISTFFYIDYTKLEQFIECIDSGKKFDNNKYNQKLSHFKQWQSWWQKNSFLPWNLYIELSLARSHSHFRITLRMASGKRKLNRFYDKKVVICHPLCHNLKFYILL